MEPIFKALSSPARRLLLDSLFEDDGQTLGDLANRLEMTRFGAMKHLAVLEDATLVVTRRSGREKLHYLNPVPIRELSDRWIAKYAEPWLSALTSLKQELESNMTIATAEANGVPEGDRHLYQIFIRATPEQVWAGITDGALTKRYFHDTTIESTWQPGADVVYRNPDGSIAVEGEVLEATPHTRLAYTWHVLYNPAAAAEAPSRVTWELEPMGETTKLTMVHDRFPEASVVSPEVGPGWHPLLSSLKSLLETGEPLNLSTEASSAAATAGAKPEITKRQLQVLRLVAAGRTNGDIATELIISSRTVEKHISTLMTGLGVTTPAEAIRKATDLGLL